MTGRGFNQCDFDGLHCDPLGVGCLGGIVMRRLKQLGVAMATFHTRLC